MHGAADVKQDERAAELLLHCLALPTLAAGQACEPLSAAGCSREISGGGAPVVLNTHPCQKLDLRFGRS